jgi:hypothetical protein
MCDNDPKISSSGCGISNPSSVVEDTSGDVGAQGENVDKTDDCVDKSCVHEVLHGSSVDNPSNEDTASRFSISSDDSICSSLSSDITQFYYFYQGKA